jgi:transketolase
VTEAIKALDILEKEGLDVGILNMSTIKPLDEEAIIRVAEQTRAIVTAENGTIIGGLGEGVAAVLAEKCACRAGQESASKMSSANQPGSVPTRTNLKICSG